MSPMTVSFKLKVFRTTLILCTAVTTATAQSLPGDAQSTCTVTTGGAPAFSTWFESGTVAANGVVKPANSVTFPDIPNCSFYQWSYQMFLWLTSPAPPRYGGGGGRIFDSPTFFDVSPPDGKGNRTFIPHTNRITRLVSVRTAQVGRNGLPVIMDKSGRMFEIHPPKLAPSGKQLILNQAGREIEVERISLGVDRKPVFLDKAGKSILSPKPIILTQALRLPQAMQVPDNARLAQKFTIDRTSIFIDSLGNVIDTEAGQADGGVLMAQNGSLIYYVTIVNDVFAYFKTGTANGGITPAPTQFPTTAADLAKITTFATAHGKTFPDPNALAIEVKTAWIETTGLPNLSSYITMQATVPTYNTSNPDHWVPNGQKTVQLAMVGLHVVGSAKGHPEMIWATFEHFGNTPNAAYTYNATSGSNPKTVAQNTAGTWLFAASGATAPFNQMHMQNPGAGSQDILSISPFHITPSNTIRFKPFGAAANAGPNPGHSTAASNTEVISMNNSVLGQLLSGDIRSNYYMTGSTWTISGTGVTGNFGNPGNASIAAGKAVGTSQMANTTMETYQQVNTSWEMFSNNCFSCHVTNTTSVSHVFGGLKPLFP